MTENKIIEFAHHEAKHIVERLREHKGVTVSEMDYSTNRGGDQSAYFTVNFENRPQRFCNVRVSDHFANPDFVTAHVDLITTYRVEEFFEWLYTEGLIGGGGS